MTNPEISGRLIGVVIIVITALIAMRFRKKGEKQQTDEYYTVHGMCFTLRQPTIRGVASTILLFFFGGAAVFLLSLLSFNELIEYYRSTPLGETVFVTLFIFGVFSFTISFSVWALLTSIFWRVQIDGDRIEYRSFIGKKTTLTFKDITGVLTYTNRNGEAIKVFVEGEYVENKKVFTAYQACTNYYLLLSRLENEGVEFFYSNEQVAHRDKGLNQQEKNDEEVSADTRVSDKTALIVAGIIAPIGAGLILWGVSSSIKYITFMNTAEKAPAVITNIEENTDSNYDYFYRHYIEYTINDITYSDSFNSEKKQGRIGERISLLYNPENPQDNEFNRRNNDLSFFYYVVGGLLFMTGMGIGMGRWRYLFRHCRQAINSMR